jgi:hypothetical protein
MCRLKYFKINFKINYNRLILLYVRQHTWQAIVEFTPSLARKKKMFQFVKLHDECMHPEKKT